MGLFRVKLIGEDGLEREMHRLADDPDTAVGGFRGLVLAVQEVPVSRMTPGRADLAMFTRKLSILLQAGIPLHRSLRVVGEQATGSMQAFVEILGHEVEKGNPLSRTLELFALSPTYIMTVRLGEEAADLPSALARLLEWLEQEEEIRQGVISALVYPAVLIGVSGATIFYLTGWVVPVFAEVIRDFGKELPLLTRAVMFCSERVPMALLVLGLVIPAASFYFAREGTAKVRERVEEWVFHLPVLGNISLFYHLSNFAASMAALLEKGLPLPKAVEVASEVVGVHALRERFRSFVFLLEAGKNFREIFSEYQAPEMMRHLMLIGEESNRMADMMREVGKYYRQELQRAQKRFLALIEPVLMLFLGGVVAILLISMFVPILELSSVEAF